MQSGRGITSVICRNDKGRLVIEITLKIITYSVLAAEALALCDAVSLVARVLFEADNLIPIEAHRGNAVRQDLQNVIIDIKEVAKNFTSVGFLWVKREGNVVVDGVVKLTKANLLPSNWSRSPPEALQYLLTMNSANCVN